MSKTNHSLYSIEYFQSKNIFVPLKLRLKMSTLLALPILALELLLNVVDSVTLVSSFIFVICFPFPLVVVYDLPNYFKQRQHFKYIKLIVNRNDITVIDSKFKKSTSFTFDDIREYDQIRYPFSGYHVMRMHVSKGRIISVGNSMRNYESFREHLKELKGSKEEQLEKYVGGGIENVF